MNPLEGLAQYLDRLERRLRLFAWTRGAAAVVGAALILTVVIVGSLMLSRLLAFRPDLRPLRAVPRDWRRRSPLALVVPLMRMNRRRAAQEVEQRHPGFDQRLLTFTERSRDNASDPFLPLLAEDALVIARDAEPEQVIDKKPLHPFRIAGRRRRQRAGLADVLGTGRFRLRHVAALGQLFEGSGHQAVLQRHRAAGLEDDPAQVRSGDHARRLSGFSVVARQIWVQYASSSQVGRSAHGAAKRRVRVSVSCWCACRTICSITWKRAASSPRPIKLHTVDLPAVKNIQRHLQLPVVDRPRLGHGRSRRRSARGGRHGGEARDPDRQASEQRADCVRRGQADRSRRHEEQSHRRPMFRSRRTARITSR